MAIEKLGTVKAGTIENGLVIFSGIVRDQNGRDEKRVCELLYPPLPVPANCYMCDKSFHVDLVVGLFHTHKMYGFVVIANETALVATLRGTQRCVIKKIQGDLMTETRRGGQSANRIARIRQEHRDGYKNSIVDACVALKDVEGVIIGGNAEVPKEVMAQIKLDTRITFKILGLVKTSSTLVNVALDEAIKASIGLIHASDCMDEKKVIDTLKDLIMNDPSKLVFGYADIVRCHYACLLEYAVVRKGHEVTRDIVNVKEIEHSDFLDAYDGMIGVLYVSGTHDVSDNPYT
jgi:peptide subunit release factor 1 (eRF1)